MAQDVRIGLSATPKFLSCKYFYDEPGSLLFQRICEVPEYYLPRVEASILSRHAQEILQLSADDLELVELGCGDSRKTRLLIDACLQRQRELIFVGIDIAAQALETGAMRLLNDHARLSVTGLIGEFSDGLQYLAGQGERPRLVLFLGSTIGNFDEVDLPAFLAMIRTNLRKNDRFLLGVDLLKDPAILTAAYDDSQGVTAQFNLNILARINRELDGEFDLASFRHCAVFDSRRQRIEMHLESKCDQTVAIRKLGMAFDFQQGETIHTENCYKHSLESMSKLLRAHGLGIVREFTDAGRQFCLFLARVS